MVSCGIVDGGGETDGEMLWPPNDVIGVVSVVASTLGGTDSGLEFVGPMAVDGEVIPRGWLSGPASIDWPPGRVSIGDPVAGGLMLRVGKAGSGRLIP